jgi:hypothetical protein
MKKGRMRDTNVLGSPKRGEAGEACVFRLLKHHGETWMLFPWHAFFFCLNYLIFLVVGLRFQSENVQKQDGTWNLN